MTIKFIFLIICDSVLSWEEAELAGFKHSKRYKRLSLYIDELPNKIELESSISKYYREIGSWYKTFQFDKTLTGANHELREN